MHPADLADHRAAKRRRALNALERDATRLVPLVVPREREALRVLIDAVHTGDHEPEDVHHVVRQCLSEQARRAA